jgi:hypothetical protein
MSAKVLGRVVASKDRPRGPDTRMTVTVPHSWMAEHATIEVDLPRNLACAVCGGGGCDACDRAGAVSLRLRTDPKESVEVTLPKSAVGDGEAPPHAITVRIPERGGMPKAGSELPRGNLLLTIEDGTEPSNGVIRLPGPSTPPPPVPELVGVEGERAEGARIFWLFAVAILAALAAWLLRK